MERRNCSRAGLGCMGGSGAINLPAMRYPPRLSHLATRPVLVSRLAPTYAEAHQIDDEEAMQRIDTAMKGALREDLLAALWESLEGGTKRLEEAGLLEKV